MQGASEVVAQEQDEEATPWMPLLRIEWKKQREEATSEALMAAFRPSGRPRSERMCNNQSSVRSRRVRAGRGDHTRERAAERTQSRDSERHWLANASDRNFRDGQRAILERHLHNLLEKLFPQ